MCCAANYVKHMSKIQKGCSAFIPFGFQFSQSKCNFQFGKISFNSCPVVVNELLSLASEIREIPASVLVLFLLSLFFLVLAFWNYSFSTINEESSPSQICRIECFITSCVFEIVT